MTDKMEAKLIGYNETRTDVSAPYATELDNLKVQDSNESCASTPIVHPTPKLHPPGVESHRFGGTSIETNREISSLPDPLEGQTGEGNDSEICSKTTGNDRATQI